MARLSGAKVAKRENFLRTWMGKQVEGEKKITLETANDALVSHFGGKEPKMRAERVYEIRDEVLSGKGKAGNGTVVPQVAKRGPGRPKGSGAKAKSTPTSSAMFCLTGDVKHLLALAEAAGVQVQVDTRATEAISALRA